MSAFLLDAWQDWSCPECGLAERTRPLPPNASRMHTCSRLGGGLLAPLVRAGADCRLVAVERGDYLGKECQRKGADGRPYMAVETRYADGRNDVHAFAPAAVAWPG